MNEFDLRQAIIDELEFRPGVHAAHIGVSVEDGVVTLTGHVASYAEKLVAEEAVKRVKGVKAIAQELEVRYPHANPNADDEIARQALLILAWDTTIPHDKIQVRLEKGWVTLAGEVEWQYQKQAAENAVRKLAGVRGVSNLIAIKPTVHPADVKKRIEDALRRNAEVEAQSIRVSVSDGKVTLDGKVRAWHERQVAEEAAWAVHGVKSVEDKLQLV